MTCYIQDEQQLVICGLASGQSYEYKLGKENSRICFMYGKLHIFNFNNVLRINILINKAKFMLVTFDK